MSSESLSQPISRPGNVLWHFFIL